MTSQEIQVLKDKLKEIESIESVINSMKKNILAHERVFAGKEISIQNTSDSSSNPIYITGEEKDEILRILNRKSEEFMNIHVKRLEKLK